MEWIYKIKKAEVGFKDCREAVVETGRELLGLH